MLSKEQRASQFIPFDALKGFQEALRQKEKEFEYTDKKELSEEIVEQISETLSTIDINDNIKVKYYKNRKYEEAMGKVKEITPIKKRIVLYDDTKIYFTDILEIEKI